MHCSCLWKPGKAVRTSPMMSRTKPSLFVHYETLMPAIFNIMRRSYMGTVWDYSGHYGTFS